MGSKSSKQPPPIKQHHEQSSKHGGQSSSSSSSSTSAPQPRSSSSSTTLLTTTTSGGHYMNSRTFYTPAHEKKKDEDPIEALDQSWAISCPLPPSGMSLFDEIYVKYVNVFENGRVPLLSQHLHVPTAIEDNICQWIDVIDLVAVYMCRSVDGGRDPS